jgi:hypothetical protein|tara:strand:- start:21862 stop:22215 length:354 start_codon:yes stop_codon:yes gene_type:complete
MKVIRFIDVVEPEEDEEGIIQEYVRLSNFTLPMIIDPNKIVSICPLFTATGKLFKNVSIITYGDDVLKVLGSPDYIWGLKENVKSTFIGFYGQQKQKTIEKRTTVKSKPKRRTKKSS